MIEQTESFTVNDSHAVNALHAAWMKQRVTPEAYRTATRLVGQGYPATVAVRLALAPAFTVVRP